MDNRYSYYHIENKKDNEYNDDDKSDVLKKKDNGKWLRDKISDILNLMSCDMSARMD